jgi:cyclophilin family peptidyl-prolyl cis-trans isomerase/HEAT repeat protein
LAPGDARLDARARLIRIEDTRDDEPVWVDSMLSAPDPVLRRAAAITAGRLGSPAHRASLHRLVQDPDSSVAASALFALGLLKDSSSAVAATAALRATPSVSVEASWLLGEIGAAGRAPLVDLARDASQGSVRRGAALLALARIRPATVEPITALLADPDTAVAWGAAYALARGRSASAVRALLGASSSPWPDVRDQAARGLGRALAGDSLGADCQAALRRLARDTSARVRVTAVRVISGYGASAAEVIRDALRDTDPSVRITAAPFAHLAFDSTSRAWNDAWRSDTNFSIRRQLAESALRVDRLRAEWAPWRTDADWQLRAAAAELDGHGAAVTVRDRLEPALRDSDARVRAAAVGALVVLVDSAATRADVRARLRAMLADPDFEVRAAALGALAKGATIEDLTRSLASYTTNRADRDADARLAFWLLADSALARHGGELPDSVVRALDAIPRPTDPLERLQASRIGRFASWRRGSNAPRPAAWYDARAREALFGRAPVARIETARGVLDLELFTSDAPVTVDNFVTLARRGYFDNQRFHRVVPDFVVQGGDPRGNGNGGPGYAIRDELNRHRYQRGTLGMALSGPNTGGSQFFVTHAPQPHLDGGYTVFGQLRAGGDVLDRIVQGDRIVRITIR